MALLDYTPTFGWFADSTTDSDIPTGSTKSNPSGLSDPTITGSPDAYADFGLTHGITFTTPSPVGEVGLGDITIVMKAQLDTSSNGRVIAENWDGSGAGNTACGWQIVNSGGTSCKVGLAALPTEAGTAKVECAERPGTTGTPFIIAFRRESGTWTVWLDGDASGGMVTDTPATNNLGNNDVFSEMNPVTIGSRTNGANPFDGRVYWLLQFNAAITDTDIQLSTWDDEASLKTLWLDAGDDFTLAVDHGSGVAQTSDVGLITTSSVTMPVTAANIAVEAQDLPFILTNPGTHGSGVIQGSDVNIIFANAFSLGVDHAQGVIAGQSVALNALFRINVDFGAAVASGSDVALTTPFILGESTRPRHRASRTMLNYRR